MVQVPFIDLSRLTRELSPEVLEDWRQALERNEFVGGPAVRRLEATLGQLLSARHVVTCGSGTAALTIALRARGVRPGDRVAVPNSTFWATYEAVAELGAEPVLIDIDPADLQLSFSGLRAAHAHFGLRAAVSVHAFGWATGQLSELRSFCKAEGIWLIEDGAQAFGVEHQGVSVFRDAEISTLSFYPAKVIGGAQDGGAILVGDDALASKMRCLANHGRRDHYSHQEVGYNSRLGSQNAYFLLRVLARADAILDWRQRAVEFYRQALAGHPDLQVHGPPVGVRENGYLSVLTLDRATDPIVDRMKQLGIHCRRTWPQTMDAQAPAAGALRWEPLTCSQSFSNRVLNLPVFYGITRQEQTAVVQALLRVLG